MARVTDWRGRAFRRSRAALVGLAALVLCASLSRAQENSCLSCHRRLAADQETPTARASARWLAEGHHTAGIGCQACHEGDPSAIEKERAHPAHVRVADPESALSPSRIEATCGHSGCHQRRLGDAEHVPCAKNAGFAHCRSCHDGTGASPWTPGFEKGRCDGCHAAPQAALKALRGGLQAMAQSAPYPVSPLAALAAPARERLSDLLHRFQFAVFEESAGELSSAHEARHEEAAPVSAGEDQCVACHSTLAPIPGHDITLPRHDSSHAPPKVKCVDCHGGNAQAASVMEAHTESVTGREFPASPLYPTRAPETCGKCHEKELRAFRASKHYDRLQKEHRGPECVRCHQGMTTEIFPPERLDLLCLPCHERQKTPLRAQVHEAKKALTSIVALTRNIADARTVIAAHEDLKGSTVEENLARAARQLERAVNIWHSFDIDQVRDATRAAELALFEARSGLPVITTSTPTGLSAVWVRVLLLLMVPPLAIAVWWGRKSWLRRRRRVSKASPASLAPASEPPPSDPPSPG